MQSSKSASEATRSLIDIINKYANIFQKPVRPEQYESIWDNQTCSFNKEGFRAWTKLQYNEANALEHKVWLPLAVYTSMGHKLYRAITTTSYHTDASQQKVIDDLDASFNRFSRPLPDNCLPLYRGSRLREGQVYDFSKGQSYISTTICLDVALGFGNPAYILVDNDGEIVESEKEYAILLIIKSISCPCISTAPFSTTVESEAEVLLPRSAYFKLLKRPYTKDFEDFGQRLVFEVAVKESESNPKKRKVKSNDDDDDASLQTKLRRKT